MSIKDFAEKNMFEPLGMKNTHFHDDQYHIVKNRVFSYSPAKDGYRNLIMRFDLVGSGGLYSNIEDLLRWDQNFLPTTYPRVLVSGRSLILSEQTKRGFHFGKCKARIEGKHIVL